MKRWFNLLLLLLMIGAMTGCGVVEETVKISSKPIEISPIPSFQMEESGKMEGDMEEEVILPRAYSYLEDHRMPVPKNQGDANSCWAFASLSALESSKDGDSQGPYSTDHLIYQNPFDNSFEEGGAYVVTVSYLLSWSGPVLESEDPADGNSPKGLREAVHVQEIRESAPKDYEAIKRFVYQYGGVETALYVDFDVNFTESSYYNEEYHSFCYMGEEIPNHDVVIVGWDDDYPAEKFVGDVQSDGAFLCQNSWGETFGEKGIFYVSYEDVNIGGYGVVYSRIDPTDNYDVLFQSDICGFTAQIGYQQESSWFANVYKTDQDLEVRAAGFYATGPNTTYEIYGVQQFKDENSFLFKKLLCKGELKDAGFYTIDFPESFSVKAGDEFAVVVKIHTENAEYPVAVECPVESLSPTIDLSDGKGYLSYQGNLWEHVEETKAYNICLKAYADLR